MIITFITPLLLTILSMFSFYPMIPYCPMYPYLILRTLALKTVVLRCTLYPSPYFNCEKVLS